MHHTPSITLIVFIMDILLSSFLIAFLAVVMRKSRYYLEIMTRRPVPQSSVNVRYYHSYSYIYLVKSSIFTFMSDFHDFTDSFITFHVRTHVLCSYARTYVLHSFRRVHLVTLTQKSIFLCLFLQASVLVS